MTAFLRRLGPFLLLLTLPVVARAELFTFDSAPIHSSLPIDQTVGGVTAHFSSTGLGFSIQAANTMGFTPAGFGGLCLYPNSIYASDLVITFSTPLTAFSILYAPQELGCDASATMRVTVSMGGTVRGTATTTAPVPGTWPTGTLSYSEPAGFDVVVVHYDQRPACTDWGPIFMADNMSVTLLTDAVPAGGAARVAMAAAPNPFRQVTHVRLQVESATTLSVSVHDAAGRLVRSLVRDAAVGAGPRDVEWDGRDDHGRGVAGGVYFCRITAGGASRTLPIVRMH